MKSFLKLILLLLIAAPAWAQHADSTDLFAVQLRLKTRNYGDSVVLRWGISGSGAWPFFSEAGYTIERLAMTDKNVPLDKDWKVLADSLKPWPLTEVAAAMKQPQYSNDNYFKLAAGMLYGSDAPAAGGTPVPHGFGDELQASDSKFGFALLSADLSPQAASMLGFRFTDRQVQAGQRYVYRVRLARPLSAFHADTAVSFVDMAERYSPVVPGRLTAIPAEHKVTLEWRGQPLGIHYTAFWIERSADGSNYTRLTTRPYLMMRRPGADPLVNTYTDSLPDNSRKMYYRITGIDAFGELSSPTPPVLAGGADRSFAMETDITGIQRGAAGRAVINWTATRPPADLLAFYVFSKPEVDAPYTLISDGLPPAARSFTDSAAPERAYYLVAAYDTAGNAAVSEPAYTFLPDSIPPAAPAGLSGSIDTAGIVTLHWPLGPEKDIRGYRIYVANQENHAFTPLLEAPIDDTMYQYKTTLQTLTRHIFYKLIAVDASGNHSTYSAMAMLTRPDRVPPAPPVINDYLVTDTAVTIRWQQSGSADVASQQIYRRTAGKETWTLLASAAKAENTYHDRSVKSGEELEYALTATDSSGLVSVRSFPLNARIYSVAPAATISDLKAAAGKGSIQLSWHAAATGGSIIISRSYNGSGFVPIGQVSSKEQAWSDAALMGKGNYRYRLQQITTEGKKMAALTAAPLTMAEN